MNNKSDNSYTYKTEAIYRRFIKDKKNSRFIKYKNNKKLILVDTNEQTNKKINPDVDLNFDNSLIQNDVTNLVDTSKINVQYINTYLSELFIEYQKQIDLRLIETIKTQFEIFASNLKGVTGDKGPEGDKGPVGEKGLEGDKGPVGDKGPEGDKGPVGDKGPEGDKGAQGLKGFHGDKGPVGDKGQEGEKGPVGDKPTTL